MLITTAPYRISFAGGGTDIPFFYQRHEGAVLSVTIDKYVYISIHPFYRRDRLLLKYSETESVAHAGEVKHRLFREALRMAGIDSGVEISSTADIPARTGMGSSSTFSVALLHALWAYQSRQPDSRELADLACELEIERLGDPIGKQDQYAAAHGGFNLLRFGADGTVQRTALDLPHQTRQDLQQRLLLFYLSDQRNSRDLLDEQSRSVQADADKFTRMQEMAALALEMHKQLSRGDLSGFADSLNQGWLLKRTLSDAISNPRIDHYYALARQAGAAGGKLLGAGGGGFLLLYAEPDCQAGLRKALAELIELPFQFEDGGARLLHLGAGPREGFIYR